MSDFNSSIYFGTPVWTNNVPEFLTPMNKLCDKYIKKAKKDLLPTIKERNKIYKRKLGDFGFSNHSTSINIDPEMWVQEFSRKGGGHHNTHVHGNQHVTGFYFLKAGEKTSMPVLHDPRPGAMLTKLPQKDGAKITYANESVHYKVKPGMMVIIPGYTPHEYPMDMGVEPFRFIHWNIQCVLKNISNATSTPTT